MRTSVFKISLLIALIVNFSSCDKMFDDKIEGNNNVITKSREIDAFNEINVAGNFEVIFTLADSTSLIVEAEENLVPFIITKVSSQKLIIEPKNNYQLDNNKAMKIFITSPNMKEALLTGSGLILCDSLTTDFLDLEISGSGKIEFNKFDANDLGGYISGSGNIVLSGKVDRSYLEITGSGSIRSLDLVHNECNAVVTGSGNIYVNVGQYLKANITGSGNIYYIGSPIVNKSIVGSGSVKKYIY